MSFDNRDLQVINDALNGVFNPSYMFRNYDLEQIYNSIVAGGGGVEVTTYRDTDSSGDTSSTTGTQFGTPYSLVIPSGKKGIIEVNGGQINAVSGGTKYATLTGLHLTFSDVSFLPTGFYFGDANGQTANKITVGSALGYFEWISPVGNQMTGIYSAYLKAIIKNTSSAEQTITIRRAVKKMSFGSFAAWNASNDGRQMQTILTVL